MSIVDVCIGVVVVTFVISCVLELLGIRLGQPTKLDNNQPYYFWYEDDNK